MPTSTMVYCTACGKQIHESAATCPQCGALQQGRPPMAATAAPAMASATDKRILPAAILCFVVGVFGAHRFYVGKVGTAIAMIFTLGGLGIWMLIDFIMIVTGSFKDENGVRITEWT
jgi:TM2 domain-containing membrane protein YozV